MRQFAVANGLLQTYKLGLSVKLTLPGCGEMPNWQTANTITSQLQGLDWLSAAVALLQLYMPGVVVCHGQTMIRLSHNEITHLAVCRRCSAPP
jgi:hypothetical protein